MDRKETAVMISVKTNALIVTTFFCIGNFIAEEFGF
jgi:hypothetical protein